MLSCATGSVDVTDCGVVVAVSDDVAATGVEVAESVAMGFVEGVLVVDSAGTDAIGVDEAATIADGVVEVGADGVKEFG